ncbi:MULTISPECIES: hemagglutinin repeat-containing protein [unclassified Acinetobacter]|uniref:two-partner secretion domain-containing protein n=1 Tax=unclassified Acinetobacter TaxID=196816 RepID=UPI0015D203C9|nr:MULTISPECIES: hemagglutinin repeat-containing protein [unclassified Acinetobacter]
MNHIYKTIWNKSKNAFDVVSETVSSKGKDTSGSKDGAQSVVGKVTGFFAVLTPLAAMLFVQQSFANVEVQSGNTRVYNANNGVQVIDIATANAAGISHNRYLNYNVDKSGQVLNNAAMKSDALSVMTQLAGKIQTNKNLDKSARVILNEVTGTNRSQLSGYIEIAGAKADLVIANPYGITCSGCGFINTDRATLTTGTPQFSTDGSINGYSIRQGNITVNGNGLNGSEQNLLQLLSRNLNVDGQINAKQLEVVTGAHDYDAKTGQVTAVSDLQNNPTYAIDSTLLGGVYADRISLISSDQGVGVKMLGNVAASAQDFILTAAGKIELKNKISAKETISLQNTNASVQQINLAGSLSAKNIEIGSQDNDQIDLGITDGTIDAENNANFTTKNMALNKAILNVNEKLNIENKEKLTVQNSTLTSKEQLSIESGTLTTHGATEIASLSRDILLKAQNNIELNQNTKVIGQKNVLVQSQFGNINIDQAKLKSTTSKIDIQAENIDLNAESDAESVQIQANDQLNIGQNSVLKSQKTLDIAAKDANVQGQIFTVQQKANIVNNLTIGHASVWSATDEMNLNAQNIELAGQLYAKNNNISAENNFITQEDSLISVAQQLSLSGENIQLAGKNYAENIDATAQSILLKNSADLIAESKTHLKASDLVQIDGYVESNQVKLNSDKNLKVTQTGLLNIIGSVELQAKDTELSGKIYANQINSTSQDSIVVNDSASLIAQDQATLQGTHISSSGLIFAKSLDLNAVETLKLSQLGQLAATDLVKLSAENIELLGQLKSINSQITAINTFNVGKDASLLHQNYADIVAKTMSIEGGIYARNAILKADEKIDIKHTAELVANEKISVKASDLQQDGLLNASNLSLEATDELKSADSAIYSIIQNADLKAKNIQLKGKFVAENADIQATNHLIQDAKISVQNEAKLGAQDINVSRTILSKNTTLTAGNNLDLSKNSVLISDENIVLNAEKQLKISGQTSSKNIQVLTKGQAIIDDSAVVIAEQIASVQAGNIDHAGWIESKNTLLTAQEDLITQKDAVLNSSQNLSLNTNKLVNDGLAYAGLIDVNASDIIVNQDGLFSASDMLEMTAKKSLNNFGNLFGKNQLSIDVLNLINLGAIQSNKLSFSDLNEFINQGSIFTNSNLDIRVNSFDNSTSGLISSNANLNILSRKSDIQNDGSLLAVDSIKLETADSAAKVLNTGLIQSENNIDIISTKLDNENKIVAKNVEIDAKDLTNKGNILAYDQLDVINNQSLTNFDKAVLHAGKQLHITSSGQIINQGDILSGGQASLISLDTKSSAGIQNDGLIMTYSNDATDQLTLQAANIQNKDISSSNLNLKTNLFRNIGRVDALNLQLSKLDLTQVLNIYNNKNAEFNIYTSFIADRINLLDNYGSLYLSGKNAPNTDLNELVVDTFNNKAEASAYFYNAQLNLKNQPFFDNLGTLTLHSAKLLADTMQNTATTNLISSDLILNHNFTNEINGFVRADSKNNSIKAAQINNKNLIFANENSQLNIDADLLVNEIALSSEGESLDSAIVSNGELNLNTQIEHANKIENSGSIYANVLSIGSESRNNTDIENKKHGIEFSSYKVQQDGSKLFTDMGLGGIISALGDINIYANNFTNNYLLNSKNGNILIDTKGDFINSTTYMGHALSNKLTWKIPKNVGIGWNSEKKVNKTGTDEFGNTIVWNQIAFQGDKGHDNGVNAGFITEIWTKNTDLSVRPDSEGTEDQYFKTLTNYLKHTESASIIADDGNVTIKVDKSGQNLGGQIYASGSVIDGKGRINLDLAKDAVFKNESLELVRDQKVTVQYLAISDEVDKPSRWDVGVFLVKDGTSGFKIPTELNGLNIEDDQEINYLVHYIQKIFYESLSDTDKALYEKQIAVGNVNIKQDEFFADLEQYLFYKDKVKNEDMTNVVDVFKKKIIAGNYFSLGSPLTTNSENYEPTKKSVIAASAIVKVDGNGHFINSIYAQDVSEKDKPENSSISNPKTPEPANPLNDCNKECGNITPEKLQNFEQDTSKNGVEEGSVDPTKIEGEGSPSDQKDIETDQDLSQENKAEMTQNADDVDPGDSEEKPEETLPVERPVYPVDKIPTVDINLPAGRNTEYIQSKDPTSQYLVERNPIYGESADVIGSSYLNELLGIDPDALLKRLGDDSYEMNLIQKQLDQLGGRNVLASGFESQVEMIQRLFSNAAESQEILNLEYGKALSADQLKNLDTDIVWMVEQKVAGQTVLVPQVYLSSKTISDIETTGSVLRGNLEVSLDVKSFTNNESTVKGGYVNITSLNDINNLSGKISGDDINLTSTQGSVNNITKVYNFGGDAYNETVVGPKASIVSKNSLVIDAAKDINNIGAALKAEGAAMLNADGDINISAIEFKKAETKNIKRGDVIYEQKDEQGNVIATTKSIGKGTMNSQTVNHEGSDVSFGSDAAMISGGNTVISGSKLDVTGQLYVQTGGNFKIESVQDTEQVTSQSSRSGFGVGGGIWGKQSQETKDFKGTNNASEVTVGSIIVDSANKIVIEGSDLNIKDKESLSILSGKKGVDILDGKDEQHHEKKTTTTTYLKATNSGQKDNNKPIYGTKAEQIDSEAPQSLTTQRYLDSTQDQSDTFAEANAGTEISKLKVGAEASVAVGAKGEASLRFSEKTVEVEKSGGTSSISSNVNSAGSLLITSEEGTVNVRGSKVDVQGGLGINAKALNVTAGQNTEYASRDKKVTSSGIYSEADASANAGVGVGASVGAMGVNTGVNADVAAQVNTTTTIGAKVEKESESMSSTTHNLSSLSSGTGGMYINVDETATFHGANVSTAGNLKIEAKDIHNLAVQDTHEETRSSSSRLAGVYISGQAEAGASASAGAGADASNINPVQGSAQASAGASAEAGAGLRVATEDSKESFKSVTNKGNTFTAGGEFSRTALNGIVDEATQVDAGSVFQKAATITDVAVSDSQTYSKNSSSHDARIGVYASAEAGVSASASASVGVVAADSQSTSRSTGLSAGVSASYTGSVSSESSHDTQAVTSSFVAREGGITSISENATTLNGAQFQSVGDITIQAGELNFNAARDTHSSSSSSKDIDVSAKLGLGPGKGDFEASASYGQNNSQMQSSQAVVGSLDSTGGNIRISTTGDANFEGTRFAANNTSIEGEHVNLRAAENTASQSSTGFNVGAGFSTGAKADTPAEQVKRSSTNNGAATTEDWRHEGGVSAEFDVSNSSSKTYQGSQVTGTGFSVVARAGGTAENLNTSNVKPDANSANLDNSNAEQNGVKFTNMNEVQKKNQQSGFELSGAASIDSQDLRDVRNARDTYNAPNSAPGSVRKSTETITSNVNNSPDDINLLNQKTNSRAITDILGNGLNKVKNAVQSNGTSRP